MKEKLINLSRGYRRVFYSGIVVLFLLGLMATFAFAVKAEEVPLYGLYETTINYQDLKELPHPYSDPFYGVELEATFISPSGKQITWWGFFDGDGQGGQTGNIWKIRYMPDELGTWNFTWKFSDRSLAGSGSFQAVDNNNAPRKPGPLRHDPDFHQWFITADGSRHVFLNMYSGQYSVNWGYDNPLDAITELKDLGFDVIFTAGGTNPGMLKKPMNARNPYPFLDVDNYIPRLQGWKYLERFYRVAYEQNIYVYEFNGFYGGNDFLDLHTKPISFQNKVIKYWLARIAPYYIFLFNIGFELPEFVNTPTWPVARAQFIKDIDPWDHPITGHELHEWSYGDSTIIDFSSLQNDGISNKSKFLANFKTMIKNVIRYKSLSIIDTLRNKSFHDIALTVWNSPSQPHPHCNECIWNAPWQEQGTEESHRKDLWDGITGGMSYVFYPRDNKIGLNAFQNANRFLKSGVEWWTMSPHDELLDSGTAYILANPGVEYIAYSSSGDSFVLNLPGGNYQWRWFNPANGIYEDSAILENSAGEVTFNKPNTKDWVLHIKIN